MARGKNVTIEVPTEIVDHREELLAEIRELAEKRDSYAAIGLFKEMRRLDVQISEKVSKYNEECEMFCFMELKKAEDPMLAAINQLTYDVIKVHVSTDKDSMEETVEIDEEAQAMIDISKLHKKVDGGIGHDKMWKYKLQQMACAELTYVAARYKLDTKTVKDSYAMSKAARAIDGFRFSDGKLNLNTAHAALMDNMNKAVEAMIGEGHEVRYEDASFIEDLFVNTKGTSRTLKVAKERTIQNAMMIVCNGLLQQTKPQYVLDYKVQKKK